MSVYSSNLQKIVFQENNPGGVGIVISKAIITTTTNDNENKIIKIVPKFENNLLSYCF